MNEGCTVLGVTNDPKIRGISKLSLKRRIAIVIIALLALTIAFCSLLLWGQHRTSIHGANLAIHSQERMVAATQLREALTEIERASRDGEFPAEEIQRFRELSVRVLADQPEDVARALRKHFASYVEAMRMESRGSSLTPSAKRYDLVLDSVNSIIEGNQEHTYRLAERLKADQSRSIRAALAFLAIFIVVLAVASYKIIAIISQPLSSLVRFLDEIDVEDDLPTSIPRFNSDVPEVLYVAKSFEQLLGRLRGYRALNVGRLLIEKTARGDHRGFDHRWGFPASWRGDPLCQPGGRADPGHADRPRLQPQLALGPEWRAGGAFGNLAHDARGVHGRRRRPQDLLPDSDLPDRQQRDRAGGARGGKPRGRGAGSLSGRYDRRRPGCDSRARERGGQAPFPGHALARGPHAGDQPHDGHAPAQAQSRRDREPHSARPDQDLHR